MTFSILKRPLSKPINVDVGRWDDFGEHSITERGPICVAVNTPITTETHCEFILEFGCRGSNRIQTGEAEPRELKLGVYKTDKTVSIYFSRVTGRKGC